MALENFREAQVTYTDSGASEVLADEDERETTKKPPSSSYPT